MGPAPTLTFALSICFFPLAKPGIRMLVEVQTLKLYFFVASSEPRSTPKTQRGRQIVSFLTVPAKMKADWCVGMEMDIQPSDQGLFRAVF